eukprot:5250620-Karenia_brevis.AAC.1
MGGRIAPSKSKIFVTTTSHRTWLATFVWEPIQQTIVVVHSMRDLGAVLSTSLCHSTTLSRARLQRGIATLKRIGRLPHNTSQKGDFALACAHAQALYGCEASH